MLLLYSNFGVFLDFYCMGQLLYTVVSDIFAVFTVFNTSCVPYKNIRHKKILYKSDTKRKDR